MKFLPITIALLIFLTTALCAQNTVSITQQGSNNTASINQSAEPSQEPSPDSSCNRLPDNDQNLILIKTRDDTSQKVFKRAGTHANLLNLNRLLVNPDSVSAQQVGAQNLIHADLNSSQNSVTLSQQGSDNTIAINPCQDSQQPAKKSDSSHIRVSMQGKGNSVQIDN